MRKIGTLGEEIVAKWLQTQNYLILEQNWYCRWGEIDLIIQAKNSLTLAFVEVKTRNYRNWDNDGIFAINEQKQAKIWQTAGLFLSENISLAKLPCRFDVALVLYKKMSPQLNNLSPQLTVKINTPIFYHNYEFLIKNYLEAAF